MSSSSSSGEEYNASGSESAGTAGSDSIPEDTGIKKVAVGEEDSEDDDLDVKEEDFDMNNEQYTERDPTFTSKMSQPAAPTPFCISPWYGKPPRNNFQQGGYQNQGGGGGYQNQGRGGYGQGGGGYGQGQGNRYY